MIFMRSFRSQCLKKVIRVWPQKASEYKDSVKQSFPLFKNVIPKCLFLGVKTKDIS
jgi:hypothetical protein